MSGKELQELREHLGKLPRYEWEEPLTITEHEFDADKYHVSVEVNILHPHQLEYIRQHAEDKGHVWYVSAFDNRVSIGMQ